METTFTLENPRLAPAAQSAAVTLAAIALVFGTTSLARAEDSSEFLTPRPLTDLSRNYKVHPIYFVPKDREPVARYREKITVLMTFVADLYRRDLQSQGYKTRGLDFVFKDGTLDVRLVRGDHNAAHYSGEPDYSKNRLWDTVSAALVKKLGHPRNRIYLTFTETHGPGPVGGRFPGENAESAPVYPYSGFALVSAWMLHDEITGTTIDQQLKFMNDPKPVANVKPSGKARPRMELSQGGCGVLSHELGHCFFMLHDQRDQRNIMAYGYNHLRQMYLKPTADKQPVRFSDDHARMLALSRFVSESFDAKDTKPPTIKFAFSSPPQPGDKEVHFEASASDDTELAAILYYESTLDCVVGGEPLQGKTWSKRGALFRPPLKPGQLLHYKILVADIHGNVDAALVSYRVPAEQGQKK